MKAIRLFTLLGVMLATQCLHAQISGQVVDLYLNRYNSATNGDKLPVKDGEILGTMHFRGWTPGNEYQSSTAIRTYVTGNPAPGYLPGRLAFYTGGSDLFNHERMTILENGYIGIGLSNPAELLDINGNIIVRGRRIFFGLGSSFADGGEAFTHSDTDGFSGLPNDVLAINQQGDFAGGVYVGCPGLRVCGTLETECFKTTKNLIAQQGNIVAFGGSSPAVDCDTPGEGDFIAYGPSGDFIAKNGHFLAEKGNIRALQGYIEADKNITTLNGHLLAPNGNAVAQNLTATTGDVTASQHVKALLGNVSADFGDVLAGNDVVAGHNVEAVKDVIAGAKVRANTNVEAGNDVTAGNNVEAVKDVIAGAKVRASTNVEAGNDITAGNNVEAVKNVIAGAKVIAYGNIETNMSIKAVGNVEAGNDLAAYNVLRVGVSLADMPAGYRAAIAGKLIAEEVRVSLQADWPDYVFEEDYQLPSTQEWEAFIRQHKHLPGVPSASEVENNGIALGEMQAILLKKIEELTLIVIEQQKQIEALEQNLQRR